MTQLGLGGVRAGPCEVGHLHGPAPHLPLVPVDARQTGTVSPPSTESWAAAAVTAASAVGMWVGVWVEAERDGGWDRREERGGG